MSSYNVAILGATGVVGQEVVQILGKTFSRRQAAAVGFCRSAGRVDRGRREDGHRRGHPQAFNGVGLAFHAGASVSRVCGAESRDGGHRQYWRTMDSSSLVVPRLMPGHPPASSVIANQVFSHHHGRSAEAPQRSSADRRIVVSTTSGFRAGAAMDGWWNRLSLRCGTSLGS